MSIYLHEQIPIISHIILETHSLVNKALMISFVIGVELRHVSPDPAIFNFSRSLCAQQDKTYHDPNVLATKFIPSTQVSSWHPRSKSQRRSERRT